MLKIGLTGGIGSGKSTVARIFETLGIPVYYSDGAAKRLMNEDPVLKQQITAHFGAAAYNQGILDRQYLSRQVFNDREKLALLNSFVHPATIEDAKRWMARQNTAYAIKEAALIFESGSQRDLDYVIGVYAPEPLRIQRAMERDSISRDQVISRMKNQMEEEKKMGLCDFVIVNDGQKAVLPQVLALHRKFLELSEV